MTPMFVDSHCHLDFPEFRERLPEVLANMKSSQVSHALCVSVDIPDFPRVLQLAQENANLYASVGVHPDYEDTPELWGVLVVWVDPNRGIKIGVLLRQL